MASQPVPLCQDDETDRHRWTAGGIERQRDRVRGRKGDIHNLISGETEKGGGRQIQIDRGTERENEIERERERPTERDRQTDRDRETQRQQQWPKETETDRQI